MVPMVVFGGGGGGKYEICTQRGRTDEVSQLYPQQRVIQLIVNLILMAIRVNFVRCVCVLIG